MPSSNGVRFALVAAALALAFLAQALLRAGRPLWASALFLAAIAAFTLAATDIASAAKNRGAVAGRQQPSRPLRLRPSPWTLEARIGAVCSILCVTSAVASLAAFYSGPPNTAGWAMFGVSAVLMLTAVPAIDGRWTSMLNRLRSGRPFAIQPGLMYEVAALVGVLLLAGAVRLHDLRELPVGLWYDEASNLSVAAAIALDPGSAPVFATTLPTLYLLPAAALTTLLGTTPEALRLISVAFSLAGIAAVYLLGRHLAGPLVGLTGAFVLAVTRWDINFARIGMHGVTMTLATALTAYLTLRAVRSGRLSDYGLAGAALGLGMWFYAAFRLFPLVVAVVLVYGVLSERPAFRLLVTRLAVFVFAALVLAAPIVQYAALEPADFFDRTRTSSVFSMTPVGEAIANTIDNLRSHALMFNVEGDPNPRHNLPGAAMLDGVSAALLVLGVAACLVCWPRTALVVLPIWLAVMLIPGVLTIPWEAPQALRTIGLLPAVAVIVALALHALWQAGPGLPMEAYPPPHAGSLLRAACAHRAAERGPLLRRAGVRPQGLRRLLDRRDADRARHAQATGQGLHPLHVPPVQAQPLDRPVRERSELYGVERAAGRATGRGQGRDGRCRVRRAARGRSLRTSQALLPRRCVPGGAPSRRWGADVLRRRDQSGPS